MGQAKIQGESEVSDKGNALKKKIGKHQRTQVKTRTTEAIK